MLVIASAILCGFTRSKQDFNLLGIGKHKSPIGFRSLLHTDECAGCLAIKKAAPKRMRPVTLKILPANYFGGTNYSNTPIGACSNVEEPQIEGSSTISAYLNLWVSGKNFAFCAWNAVNTPYFQAVGDPFVAR